MTFSALGCLLLLGLGNGQDRAQAYHSAAAKLSAELALARREGLPTRPADLARRIPLAQNAAPLYQKAYKLYKGSAASAYRRATELEAKGQYREALAVIRPHREWISVLREAAKRPDMAFERDWSSPMITLFPEFATLKSFAKSLALEANALARIGEPKAALDRLELAATVSSHLRKEPTLIAMLVRIAIEAIVSRGLERLSSSAPRSSSVQQGIEALVRTRLGPPPNLLEGLSAEVVMGQCGASLLDAEEPSIGFQDEEEDQEWKPIPGVSRSVQMKAYRYRNLNFWRRAFAEMRSHPGDPMRQTAAMSRLEEQEVARAGQPTFELNAFYLPVFGEAGKAVAQAHALRRMLVARTGLMRHRIRSGSFPATLAAARITERDPFDGKPLRYKREGSGFRLWSIGPNLVDDGGVARGPIESDNSKGRYDIVMFEPFRIR